MDDWPNSIGKQQATLTWLLAESRLRLAWRDECQQIQEVQEVQEVRQNFEACAASAVPKLDANSAAYIESRGEASALPMVEILLYQGYIRSAAHQLVCLPEAQWLALPAQSPVPYAPERIDRATVLRIAHRIARVFNVPPIAAAGASAQGVVPALEQMLAGLQCMPTVWSCHPATLTHAGTSCHGMVDRLENE